MDYFLINLPSDDMLREVFQYAVILYGHPAAVKIIFPYIIKFL